MSLGGRLIWTGRLAARRLTQPRFPFRSPAAIERAQRRRLRGVVHYAYRHVPYYRETMDRLGLRPEEFQAASDLTRLPLIEREQLQRDPLYFVTDEQPPDRFLKMQSGGSTGAPVTVFRDPIRPVQIGFHERRIAVERRIAGKRWGVRMLDVASPLSPAVTIRRAVSERIVPPSRLATERHEMSLMDSPSEVLAAIDELRPDVISSYGSYLEVLFQHAHRHGIELHWPRVAVYHSDALAAPARRLIEEHFGIEVLTFYSAVEAATIGFECERHTGLHLNCDLNPVRIVGDDGEELPDGESGEVAVSNLVNRATVLLNYRLGDVAAKLPGPCPCGRSLPQLSFLEGRVGDWIRGRDGEAVHPQAVRTLFTEEEHVWRYQVVQRSLTHFAIALVTAAECDRASLQRRLARTFAARFGNETTIEVSFVDSIARTERGKIRTVISHAGSRSAA